jgi:hypothetical protein
MTQNLLDKHPGSRRYVAHLHTYGATRAQICAKLAEKYPLRAPSLRSMTQWLNSDPELVKMIRELEAIEADMSDDSGLAELPEPVNIERIDVLLFTFLDDHPAFAALLFRESVTPEAATPAAEATTPGRDWWREPSTYGDDPERTVSDVIAPDVLAVLSGNYDTGAEFDAACVALLPDDWDSPAEPTPGAGILEPVE